MNQSNAAPVCGTFKLDWSSPMSCLSNIPLPVCIYWYYIDSVIDQFYRYNNFHYLHFLYIYHNTIQNDTLTFYWYCLTFYNLTNVNWCIPQNSNSYIKVSTLIYSVFWHTYSLPVEWINELFIFNMMIVYTGTCVWYILNCQRNIYTVFVNFQSCWHIEFDKISLQLSFMML